MRRAMDFSDLRDSLNEILQRLRVTELKIDVIREGHATVDQLAKICDRLNLCLEIDTSYPVDLAVMSTERKLFVICINKTCMMVEEFVMFVNNNNKNKQTNT